jgi:hypothetical protein
MTQKTLSFQTQPQQVQTQMRIPKRKPEWLLIFELMQNGKETTLPLLQSLLKWNGHWYSETSISARLRELARGKQPGWTVSKRTENGRTWYYKLVRQP